MNTTPDGDYQTYKAEDGAYVREHFFGRDPRTRKMVEHLSDDEIWNLTRGGHDYRKVYAAYKAATEHKGQPTVILAKTIKGWTLGAHFEGRNATHQMKKLTLDDLKDVPRPPAHPDHRRAARGEPLPAAVLPPGPGRRRDPVHARAPPRARRLRCPSAAREPRPLTLPGDDGLRGRSSKGSGKQEVATTMAFVRCSRT